MNRPVRLVAAVILAALGACTDEAPTSTATVKMREDQRFGPRSLTVSPGTTVRFVNESAQAHTVTAYDDGIPGDARYFASGGFATEQEARDSLADGIVGQEETYAVELGVAGTYEYFCIPHESQGMRGTIVVEEG